MTWLIIPLASVLIFLALWGIGICILAPFVGWPWTPEPLYWYGQSMSALDTPPEIGR